MKKYKKLPKGKWTGKVKRVVDSDGFTTIIIHKIKRVKKGKRK